MFIRLILFLILNFGGLAIGSLFTNPGVGSEWYSSLDKAPWTPPGWMFGAAWSTIMICFSIYLAIAWEKVPSKNTFLAVYLISLILNILWNPLFFHFHFIGAALLAMIFLIAVVTILFLKFQTDSGWVKFLLLPYLVWLLIAISLNAYILINN